MSDGSSACVCSSIDDVDVQKQNLGRGGCPRQSKYIDMTQPSHESG